MGQALPLAEEPGHAALGRWVQRGVLLAGPERGPQEPKAFLGGVFQAGTLF